MPDFGKIRDVKARARQRLLAIPGVHCVAIGPKVVGGQLTAEPVIAVFVTKKKPLAEISPAEVIPAEIEGIKTDVVEEELPQLLAGGLPDEHQYPVLAGGIQIQAGNKLIGKGTLGCIAKTDDPNPKVVAITNQHVVTAWGQKKIGIVAFVYPDGQRVILQGSNLTGMRIECSVTVTPTNGTAQQLGPFRQITTNTDTPVTVTTQLATAINAAANPNATAQATQVSVEQKPAGNLALQPAAGFTAQMTCQTQIMWIDATSTKVITLQGNNVAGLIVLARIVVIPVPTGDFQYLDIFYRTLASDTLTSVAKAIADRINGLSNPAVTAAGPATPNGTEVTITSGTNFVASFDPTENARAYYPEVEDPDAKLKATITNNVIDLSGKTNGDNYGIYPNINTGGQPATTGYFLQPANNSDAGAMTTQIVGLLTGKNIPNITSQASGPQQITITGAEEVECVISSDVRVGQPVNTFNSGCLRCVDRRIGRVLDARLDVDIALIQLDAGLQYKAEVVATPSNWVIAGTHEVTADEVVSPFTYRVKKRGRTTGVTNGGIQYLHADGDIGTETVFHRHFTDAIKIVGPSFSGEGDSGAAILNSANEVVGILFAGTGNICHATPIQAITNAFNITIESATQANDIRTVPQLAAPPHAARPTSLARAAVAAPVIRMGVDWNQLQVAEQELAATRAGEEFLDVVRKHAPETQKLIVRNRHFAAVWHRSGGTQILQAILRMPQYRDQSLPSAINGKPLTDCLGTIQRALYRYGSRELSADLARQVWFIETAATLTYCELLAILQSRTE